MDQNLTQFLNSSASSSINMLTNDENKPVKKFKRNLEALEVTKSTNNNLDSEFINENKNMKKEPIRYSRNLDRLEEEIITDFKEK